MEAVNAKHDNITIDNEPAPRTKVMWKELFWQLIHHMVWHPLLAIDRCVVVPMHNRTATLAGYDSGVYDAPDSPRE